MPCSTDDCDRAAYARGMCRRHYRALLNAGPVPCVVDGCDENSSTRGGKCAAHGSKICLVDGCERRRYANALCEPHYLRVKKHGDPLAHVPVGQMRTAGRELCHVDGCQRLARKRDMCPMHYQRGLRAGDFAPDECFTCVDAEWLIDSGESPENVVTRLGWAKASSLDSALDGLRKHLSRHARGDLADRLSREREYA